MAAIIPITTRCNQNCLFCAAQGRRVCAGLSQIFRIIDGEKKLLVISGGEPTLSKDLFKILKYGKKKNLTIELQSNGVTLSYPDLAKKLVDTGVNLFNINFPSHSEELTNILTRTKGFFKKRLSGINNLRKLGAEIRFTHIINSLNLKYLSNFVDYVINNFNDIKYLQFSFIKILGNAKSNIWLIPKYEAVKTHLLEALNKCRKNKIGFIIDHIPTCYLADFKDCHADFIKLKTGTGSEFSLKEKVKLGKCRECGIKQYCYGVRRDYVRLFGVENIGIAPYKNEFKTN